MTKYPKAKAGSKIAHHPAGRLLQLEPALDWHTLQFDGSCRDNGSAHATGRWSFHLTNHNGETVGVRSGAATGSPVTNNVAEWQGVLNGLRHTAGTGNLTGLLIEGDSDLVISQISGRWKARRALAESLAAALDLLAEIGLPWSARWIPREQNTFCDSLTKP